MWITGLIEVGSAVALLLPSIAPFGAIALVPTMVGAILARLFIVGGSPFVPAVLLVVSLTVAWARPDRERSFASKLNGRLEWAQPS